MAKNYKETKQICKICGNEFKNLGAHLIVHKTSLISYYKTFEPEQYYEKLVNNFIFNYYHPVRSKFLLQTSFKNSEVSYITVHTINSYIYNRKISEIESDDTMSSEEKSRAIQYLSGLRKLVFCEIDTSAHINGEKTVGIYTKYNSTTFLTFDVDEDDQEIVEKIFFTLNKLGIDDDQILACWSGSKGYHISIFFSNYISHQIAKKLFDIVIYEAGLNTKRGNGADTVEARGCNAHGVKLPLGINLKNTIPYSRAHTFYEYKKNQGKIKGNYCYLVNRNCCEINTIEKLESIQKIDIELVNEIVNDYETYEDYIPHLVPDKSHDNISPTGINFEYLTEAPIEPGTRHNRLFEIACYNKSSNFTYEENLQMLTDFSSNPMHHFTTPYKENLNDIRMILNTIYYSKNAELYNYHMQKRAIYFTKYDILEILYVKNKRLRKFYFFVMLQAKLYADKDNNFNMPYNCQFLSWTSNSDARNLFEKLQEMKKLDILIQKQYLKKEDLKKNNIFHACCVENLYHLVYKPETSDEGFELLTDDTSKPVSFDNFLMMCAKVFKLEDIRFYFKEYDYVKKFKYQSLSVINF